LFEIKSGTTTLTLVPIPAVAQPSSGYPGFVVAPFGVTVSGAGAHETIAVSDFATGTIVAFSPGGAKLKWQAPLATIFSAGNASWMTVDGNGFLYASTLESSSSQTELTVVTLDATGKPEWSAVEPFADLQDGLAFTASDSSATARATTKRNLR
jgi:outer membrane protein assembly factor BamB